MENTFYKSYPVPVTGCIIVLCRRSASGKEPVFDHPLYGPACRLLV